MDQPDPRCDLCDSPAVIRDPDGLWCAKCALARIANNRDDQQGSSTEEGARNGAYEIGNDTHDQPDGGQPGRPQEETSRSSQ